MLTAVAAGASHPAVAVLLGLGSAGLAGAVVAMAWSVHLRQMRLAEHLARRQFLVTADAGGTAQAAPERNGKAAGSGATAPVVIEGPESVVVGEQARYRVRSGGSIQVVSWAVGGGAASQSPDPAHPDDLLVIADQPGNLTIIVRAREGMLERRATKSITAVEDVTAAPAPPFSLRLFLNAWGLAAVAALIVGCAAALVALGNLAPSDFIAVVVPLAALLGVVAVGRGADDPPRRPSRPRDQPAQLLAHLPSLPSLPSAEALVHSKARNHDHPD
jgi:hypothetical protein